MSRNVPRVRIYPTEVHPPESYPVITIYDVEVLADDGVWLESFATEAEVHAFLRGLQAGSQMNGGPYFPLPDFPLP